MQRIAIVCMSLAALMFAALSSLAVAADPPAAKKESPPAATAKAAASPEKGWVEALRAEKPCNAPEQFARAVRRIVELRGKIQCDASGRLVAVDLASGRISVADADAALLVALPNLARLQMAGTELTPAAAESLVACKNLAELSLVNTQIDDTAVGKLAALPRLSSLRIQRAAKLTDACVDSLVRMKGLAALALIEINLSDAVVPKLARMERLKLLDLRACPRITNEGLKNLTAMKNLRTLRLRGYNVNDETLKLVAKMAWLTGLSIEDAGITDAGLKRIKDLPLEDLSLFRCFSVTDGGLECLAGYANLRLLTLRDMPLMGTCLAGLRDNNKKLASLVLNETGISDESLEYLAGLKSLTRLELRQLPLRDGALAPIGALTNLRVLDLENTRITARTSDKSKGLQCLASLAHLEQLSLKMCIELGDDAVPLLGKLKSLRSLNIMQTNITPAGVERLKTLLPNCEIQR